MGERGHDVDNCYTLKLKVQNLLDKGRLTFKEATPNVQQNPLPDHAEGVNMILGEMQANERPLVVDAPKLYEALELAGHYERGEDITMEEKLEHIRKMIDMGVIRSVNKEQRQLPMMAPSVISSSSYDATCDCEMKKAKPPIPEEGEQVAIEDALKTDSEGTFRSRDLLKKICDEGEVFNTLGQPSGKYDYYVKYSPASSFFDDPKDIIPDGWGGMDDPIPREEGMVAMITPVVIELPDEDRTSDVEMKTTEPMTIDLMVKELSAIEILEESLTPVVIELPPQGKDEMIMLESPLEFNTKAVPWDYGTKEVDTVTRSGRCYAPTRGTEKKAVTEEDARQFLAVVKTSEFNVVNQLRKMPAQISILELI